MEADITAALVKFAEDDRVKEEDVMPGEGGKFARENFKKYPHAFLIGCLMDMGVPSKRAWAIPCKIKNRVGGFDLPHLLENVDEIGQGFLEEKLPPEKKWHRYNSQMADNTIAALEKVAADYDGNAANIWRNRNSPGDIVHRFKEFKGIGPKIAAMATHILTREFGVETKAGDDFSTLDIAPDTHVRRVFVRSGLVSRDNDNDVIDKARLLHPKFPGALDLPAWYIGMHYCKWENAKCSECPLDKLCPKNPRPVKKN